MTRNNAGRDGWRINILSLAVIIIPGLIFLRIFYVSYLRHDQLVQTAQNQYQRAKDLKMKRGDILIHASGEYLTVAGKTEFPYIYVIPKLSKEPSNTARKLSMIMPAITEESFIKVLSKKNDPFELVEKKVSPEKIELIKNLNLPEVKIGYEESRIYPLKSSLSHVIGFLGFNQDEREGQYGLEGVYNDLLKKNTSLVLTIDNAVQSVAESNLSDLMKKWSAPSGTIIVQDPNTGAIITMASSPSFDPNSYSDYPLYRFMNPAVQEIFEPGSTFKGITMSAGIDKGLVSPLTTYEDKGIVTIGGYTIKNFDEKTYGIKTMTQVLEKSLNTGAVFVQKLLGNDSFLNYVVIFGFGKDGKSADDIV